MTSPVTLERRFKAPCLRGDSARLFFRAHSIRNVLHDPGHVDAKCDYRDVAGASLLDGLWFAAAISAADQGDAQLQGQIDDLSGQVEDLNRMYTARPRLAGVLGPGTATASRMPKRTSTPMAYGTPGIARASPGRMVQTARTVQTGPMHANCWDTIGDYNADGQCDRRTAWIG